jgi:hypothetical protein
LWNQSFVVMKVKFPTEPLVKRASISVKCYSSFFMIKVNTLFVKFLV